MEIVPILSALRRSKVGAVLIGLQIALTLAIVCNALFIIAERSQRMQRPSGIDEASLISFTNQWVGEPEDIESSVRADLAALRAMPDVVDAAAVNSYPLRGGGWSSTFSLEPRETFDTSSPQASQYMLDERGLDAWGLKLVEGRWFEPGEIRQVPHGQPLDADVILLTRALADLLFPGRSPLNQTVYAQNNAYLVVGVVERLQTPWAATGFGESFVESSVVLPIQWLGPTGQYYTVRAKPGRETAVMNAIPDTLKGVSRARVIQDVRTFAETRALRYRADSALTKILIVACALLLVVTACGIVGLTSYWIAQRRRQIGVRRALGATRGDILRYFHLENVLIAVPGAVLGAVASLALNAWAVSMFEMQRLSVGGVLGAAVAVVLLGQLAVLWPAMRAAAIAPATATRAV